LHDSVLMWVIIKFTHIPVWKKKCRPLQNRVLTIKNFNPRILKPS
jgi:hypothetical protein